MSYQDRVDIDRLYGYIWDRDTEQLKVLTKDEFNEYKDFIEFTYYNKIGTDGRYALIGHTHTKSEISDFAHTHTKSEISDFAHTHFKSEINDFSHTHPISEVTGLSTALSNKQDTIPSLEEVREVQTIKGAYVHIYSDGLNVCLTYGGTLSGNSEIPIGGNYATLGTLTDTDYAPPFEMQSPTHSSNNNIKIVLKPNGNIDMLNTSSSRTFSFNCSFYYPLKSRMPQTNSQ